MKHPDMPVKILEGIHWVGAIHETLRHFDVIMETKYGTSYNSYLVQGSEKTALIDTVRDGFLDESLALIRQLIDPSKIDYIILQHTEPDHSGSLAELLKLAPHARILSSKPGSLYLPHIANRELPIDVVKEGDTVDLGGRKLRFIMAPFLHWPDTIFTYEELSGALFTCDAFGCHFAPEHVLESRTDESFKDARRFYFDCIMRPFAGHVTRAVAHVTELNLPIRAVLPSHGPVLDQNPEEGIALYREWASEHQPLTGKRVFIGYVSCYGYTRLLAEKLAEDLGARGAEIDMADIAEFTPNEAASHIHRADALAIGSPTVNADAMAPIWMALMHVSIPVVRGRSAAVFGSYGWSGEAVPMVEQRLIGLGYKVAGTVRARLKPNAEALDEISFLADKLALAMKL